MPNYLTFQNIYQSICRAIKDDSQAFLNLVKDMANMVYLSEILEADDLYPLHWLIDFDDSLKARAPAESITDIPQTAPINVADATHTFKVGDLIMFHDVGGTVEVEERMFYVTAITAGVSYRIYDLDNNTVDGSTFTAFTSGGKALHCGLALATTYKNVERILSAGWKDISGNMEEAKFNELEELKSYWDENPSRPKKYYHMKRYKSDGTEINLLLWFPGADQAYDLRYWFKKRVDRLSADGDIPILPPQFHDLIISGTVTRLAENNVQVENQVVWPGIYKMGLNNLRTFNRKWWDEHPEYKKEIPYLL